MRNTSVLQRSSRNDGRRHDIGNSCFDENLRNIRFARKLHAKDLHLFERDRPIREKRAQRTADTVSNESLRHNAAALAKKCASTISGRVERNQMPRARARVCRGMARASIEVGGQRFKLLWTSAHETEQ